MKYGILGDIHANLSALETAIRFLEDEDTDVFVSVGDVVGYGAAPVECIELLREVGARVVKGNHDAACAGEIGVEGFNRYAQDAVAWTRTVLPKSQASWLRGLPLVLDLVDCEVAHGTLVDPERWEYLLGIDDAMRSLDRLARRVCFVGHSHVPLTVVRPREAAHRTALAPDPELELTEMLATIANVGSVGQPRDHDPRLAVALYDGDSELLTLHRLEYDVEREAARIVAAGLPVILGDRLRAGV
ncbi:MAG TPA: metallophosphoesterase family protein [Planctomycetota bacterium]|nr:metallophosphoesterase family protein [Planctomycetota bacterium]